MMGVLPGRDAVGIVFAEVEVDAAVVVVAAFLSLRSYSSCLP